MPGQEYSPATFSDADIAAALGRAFGNDGEAQHLPEQITEIVERRTLEGGETLVRVGETSDSLYILLSGRLLVENAAGDLIGEVRPGETVGEIGVIAGTPRNATVRAVRMSLIASIAAEDFTALVRQHPGLGLAVARTMIARERRSARPRHPAIRPDTVAIVPLHPGADVAGLRDGILGSGVEPTTRQRLPGSINRAPDALADRVVVIDRSDPDAARKMRHADEIVMVADLDADPSRSETDDFIADCLPDMRLPRRTLVLLRAKDAAPPKGTAAWLDQRRVDRHIHVRSGDATDAGRLARLLFGRAVGLVMAGGGARGAAHLGAIRALAEIGIEPDIIGGTSIGAALGALYSMGLRDDDLEDAAKDIFVRHGSPTGDWTFLPLISLVKGDKTRMLCRRGVERNMGHHAHIEDLLHPYFAVAGNMTEQKQAVMKRGMLWQALSASYAIPGVLPPVAIDGALYVDGGVVNNLPVDVMEDFDAAHIISVDLLGETHRRKVIETVPSGSQALRDRFRPRKSRRYRVPGILTTLLTATMLGSLERQKAMRERADICLVPDLPRISLLDWGKFEKTIEHGYESCRQQLAEMDPAALAKLRR